MRRKIKKISESPYGEERQTLQKRITALYVLSIPGVPQVLALTGLAACVIDTATLLVGGAVFVAGVAVIAAVALSALAAFVPLVGVASLAALGGYILIRVGDAFSRALGFPLLCSPINACVSRFTSEAKKTLDGTLSPSVRGYIKSFYRNQHTPPVVMSLQSDR